MSAGMMILENEVKAVRRLIDFTDKIESLRQAEQEASERGDISKAMAAFTERIAIIAAGPGGSQALAMA